MFCFSLHIYVNSICKVINYETFYLIGNIPGVGYGHHFAKGSHKHLEYGKKLLLYSLCICKNHPNLCSNSGNIGKVIKSNASQQVCHNLYSRLMPQEMMFYVDNTTRSLLLRERLLKYALHEQTDRAFCSQPYPQQAVDFTNLITSLG